MTDWNQLIQAARDEAIAFIEAEQQRQRQACDEIRRKEEAEIAPYLEEAARFLKAAGHRGQREFLIRPIKDGDMVMVDGHPTIHLKTKTYQLFERLRSQPGLSCIPIAQVYQSEDGPDLINYYLRVSF